MNKKKTAIYVRVSVLKEEAVSPQMQMGKAKQYCQLHDEKYEVFQDLDFSGKDTNRPAFQQMVSHIKMGLISKLVVYRLDRVSRSVKDLALFMDMLKEKNVEFYSITENFDTSTPMGRAMINIMAVFAQMEREVISQRILDTKAKQMADGIRQGIAPYGYKHKLGSKGSRWEIVPQEARMVKKVFELYATGKWSCKSLATYLNRNFPRRNRKKRRGQSTWGNGKYSDKWQSWTVRNIIRTSAYAGIVSAEENLQATNLKPIISRELFRRCEEIRSRRSPRHTLYCHATTSDSPLKGKIYCSCGRAMGIRSDYKPKIFYSCPNFHKKSHAHHAPASMVYQNILDYLKTCKLDKKVIQDAKRKLVGSKDQTEAERMHMINQLQRSYERLQEQYIDGEITKTLLTRKTKEIKSSLQELQPKVGSSSRIHLLDNMPAIIRKLRDSRLSSTQKFREEVIRLFVEKVVWSSDHISSMKIYDEFERFFPSPYIPQRLVSSYELIKLCPDPKPDVYQIRRWNQKGLLPDKGTCFGSSKRYHPDRSLRRIRKITYLIGQGYRVEEIGRLLRGESVLVRKAVIAQMLGISRPSARYWLLRLVKPVRRDNNNAYLYNLPAALKILRNNAQFNECLKRRRKNAP